MAFAMFSGVSGIFAGISFVTGLPLVFLVGFIRVFQAEISQGRWAQRIMCFLRFTGPVFLVPHPSIRGRNSYGGEGAQDIEIVFRKAYELIRLHTLEAR